MKIYDNFDIIQAFGYAKVNLSLWIDPENYDENGKFTPKNSEGKHIIQTMFYSLPELFDDISIQMHKSNGIDNKALYISEINTINNVNGYFHDIEKEDNIVQKVFDIYASYNVFRDEYNSFSIEIIIDKHIPMAAGLAGGSADAAAASICFEKLCNEQKLTEHYDNIRDDLSNLGADYNFARLASENDGVAFAFGSKYGDEILDMLRLCGKEELVNPLKIKVIPQNDSIKTKDCYREYDKLVAEYSKLGLYTGAFTMPDSTYLADSYTGGRLVIMMMFVDSVYTLLSSPNGEVPEKGFLRPEMDFHLFFSNNLEIAAVALCPDLKDKLDELKANNPQNHYMITGSGPTIVEIEIPKLKFR